MKINKTSLGILLLGLLIGGSLAAAPAPLPNPDFTKGEPVPEGATKDWNLGATGARGWMHTQGGRTVEARQVLITKVAPGSPADGVLAPGDVILGVAGKPFSHDPRQEWGKALTAAEGADGKFSLSRWRAGKTDAVTLNLPVLGSYSPTAPYDCAKSKLILAQSSEALAKRMERPDYKENAISRSLNALGLLATGDPKYLPLIKREAEWAAAYAEGGYQAWWYGYVTVFLAEYALATGDESVLPGLRRIALESAKGQSRVGSWGHRFAMPDGRLFGYGMMNSPGIPLTVGLVLAREAGVDDPEVAMAIQRSTNLLRFFVGKGSVPYGDHPPFMLGHEDNGKCGMAAVLFDQLGEKEGTEFFAKMSTAAHGNERDQGHTGNFFNMTWAMPGVSRAGSHATGAWMEEFGAWYFDLARSWDGSFPHQGPAQARDDSYGKWDATGVYLIAYAMPLKKLRLTGSKPSTMPPLEAGAARQVVLDGRGFTGYGPFTAYDGLPPDVLIDLLANWSPIVRTRASAAIARRGDMTVEPLIQLLDSPSVEARLGACEALAAFRDRAAPAVPKLQEALRADDLWLRVKAAETLNAIGAPAMVAVPEMLRMATAKPSASDPRGMEQRYLVKMLFNPRGGLLGRSLDGVNRELLYGVVRAGLQNEDGHARGAFSSVYSNLSFEELRPLMPVIHQAILDRSPSGEMFDGQIQTAGLDLFSKHHVSEGIGLLADYVRTQKPHGSQNTILTLLEMLKRYGAHAQRAIPQLEKAIHYFENEEPDFPKALSLQKAEAVRKAIKEIRALTDKPDLIELSL
ncbi:HEAT repeat domain-containing protein [Akkermansiaceae bacterium]|nr:HEAT repeat domain-containing protein [Akkermansiaceae bacterium]